MTELHTKFITSNNERPNNGAIIMRDIKVQTFQSHAVLRVGEHSATRNKFVCFADALCNVSVELEAGEKQMRLWRCRTQ